MGAIARIKSALGLGTKNEVQTGEVTVRIPDKGDMVHGTHNGTSYSGLVEAVDYENNDVLLPRKTVPLETVTEVTTPEEKDLPDHPAFEVNDEHKDVPDHPVFNNE